MTSPTPRTCKVRAVVHTTVVASSSRCIILTNITGCPTTEPPYTSSSSLNSFTCIYTIHKYTILNSAWTCVCACIKPNNPLTTITWKYSVKVPRAAPRYHGHGRSIGLHRYIIIIINFLYSCFIYAPTYVFGGHSFRTSIAFERAYRGTRFTVVRENGRQSLAHIPYWQSLLQSSGTVYVAA